MDTGGMPTMFLSFMYAMVVQVRGVYHAYKTGEIAVLVFLRRGGEFR